MLARRAVGRGLVAGVAAPAVAALQQHDTFAHPCQVGQQMLPVVAPDLRSDRDLDHNVLAAGAGPVLAGAALAALGPEMLGVAKVDQRIEPVKCLEGDVTALAAVAPVGPAELDELLAPKAHRAGAAGARTDVDL